MKIAYLIDYLFSVNGGTERQLHLLIRGMQARGHEVELFVLRDTEFTRTLRSFDCPVQCLGIASIFSPAGAAALVRFRGQLLRRDFDVVHGFFNDVAVALPFATVGTGLRAFTSRRDMGFWYAPKSLWALRAQRWLGCGVICNCAAVAEHAARREWRRRATMKVIVNGVEPFKARPGAGGVTRAPAEPAPRRIKVVLVANVRPIKNIEQLIEAMSLGATRYDVHVLGHISDERYRASLESSLDERGLRARFHFEGPVAEPRAILGDYDIGVLTSHSEGLSNTLIEYLDAGLPIVCSNVGGNSEIVKHEENGYLYAPGSARELAAYLDRLVSAGDLRSAFGTASKKRFDRFDLDTMLAEHEKEYSA
jgi:glycosyltransferase involved in cell wall biosynthesis